MNRAFLIIALALSLAVFGCSGEPTRSQFETYTWDVATAEEQGFNPQILDSAFAQARQLGFVDGLLVIRNGRLVAERYYNGYTGSTPHNVMSVSKSFLSAMTGIALRERLIENIDVKVLPYFPEYIYPDIDERKYDISIRHLLSMRMGIESESSNYWTIYNSDNWLKTTIELPLLSAPGERHRYNTFQTHLLSAIITKASGMDTKTFAETYLLDPMRISLYHWEQGPQGYYFGGNSMHFSPREMAVLGYLYLQDGMLDGTQIVPKEWVDFTLSPSTDNSSNQWGAFENYNYAYLWWLGQINGHDLFMGYGWGGQFVVVFPSLNLVVVSTADPYVDGETSTIQEFAIFDIIADYILPAIN